MGNEVSSPHPQLQADDGAIATEPVVDATTSDPKPKQQQPEQTEQDLPPATSTSFSVSSRQEKLQKAKLQKAKLRKPIMNVALLHETLGKSKSSSDSKASRKKNKYRFNKDDNSLIATSNEEASRSSSEKQPATPADQEDTKTQGTEETEKTKNTSVDPPDKESEELVSIPSEAFQTIAGNSVEEQDELQNKESSVSDSTENKQEPQKDYANKKQYATERGVEIMVNGSMNENNDMMTSFKIKCASDDTSSVAEDSCTSSEDKGVVEDDSTKCKSENDSVSNTDSAIVDSVMSQEDRTLFVQRKEEGKAALEQINLLRGMIRAQYGIGSDQSQMSALKQGGQPSKRKKSNPDGVSSTGNEAASANDDSEWDRDSKYSVSSPNDGRSLSDDSKSIQVETTVSNLSIDGPKSPEGTVISRNDLPPSPNSKRKPRGRREDTSTAEQTSNSPKNNSYHSSGNKEEPVGNSPMGKLSVSEFYDENTNPEEPTNQNEVEGKDSQKGEALGKSPEPSVSLLDNMTVLSSTEGDQGIDVKFVEQYESLFEEFISKKQNFSDNGNEFMTSLKVIKLQKILGAINEAKERLANQSNSAVINKTEENDETSYASTEAKLLEVLQTKAKREVKLKEELSSTQKEKEAVEADLMWKCIVASEKRAKNQKWILEKLTHKRARGEELLSFLPDIPETSLIVQCLKKPHVLPDDLLRETVHFQVDNALLHAETVILECHLQSFLEGAKSTAWVETVFLQMTKEQLEALKTAYATTVGVTLT